LFRIVADHVVKEETDKTEVSSGSEPSGILSSIETPRGRRTAELRKPIMARGGGGGRGGNKER
jgi:hypothetical protein